MRKIDLLNKFEPLIADESIRFVSSEDWAKKSNKNLKKKLAQVRTKHLFFILCFPLKIYKVEKTYLENFVNYWCLTGDTKILIKDYKGMIINYPIKKLTYKKNYQVATYNIKYKQIEFKIPEKTIKTKKQAEIYELELENGQKIKCTKEHLFLTDRGYIKLKCLNKNIHIMTINGMVKIKKIIKLEKKEDVYDIIGVPNNHNFFANNIVVHNCDIYSRGRGVVFVKDKNPVQDSWRQKDFMNIGSYNEFTASDVILEKLKKHPNFWQAIKLPKVPLWLYDKYIKVREKNVYDDDVVLGSVSTEDIHRALLIMALRDIMLNDQTLTMNRIILHLKSEYDVALTKGQVQAVLEDCKQLVIKIREKAIEA